MKSRYEDVALITSKTISNRKKDKNVITYSTPIYETIPEDNSDSYIITQAGDRLDNLASLWYGDSSKWWFIAHVNNINTMTIEPGTSLRIPSRVPSNYIQR